jgi:hypothetical protein
MVDALTDTGEQINIQQNVNTAVVQSRTTAQSGETLLCASAGSSSSNYTCAMHPTLVGYTTGMVLFWKPNVNALGGNTTLDVDTLGAKSVKMADGVTDPTGADLRAGTLYPIWYDGSSFRLIAPATNVGTTATRPDCDASQRGRIWQTLGGSGVKDVVAVCAKDASDAHAWRLLY